MKDYSNYYPSLKDRMINDGTIVFQNQSNDMEGYSASVDNNYVGENDHIQVVVQQHTNPLNEYKEDRKLMCLSSTIIHRGSVVHLYESDKDFLVTTDIDDNGIYKSSKMSEVYFLLKYNKQSPISVSCLIKSKTTPDITPDKLLVIEDGEILVSVPDNEDSEDIKSNYRFLLNKTAWQVTGIDKVTQEGIINFTMSKTDILPNDDLENGIAYNEEIDLSNDSGSGNFLIDGSDIIYYNNQKTYSIKTNDGSETNKTFTWSLDNLLATFVSQDSLSCVLKAGNTYGQSVLTATCNEDNSIVLTKTIKIQDIF